MKKITRKFNFLAACAVPLISCAASALDLSDKHTRARAEPYLKQEIEVAMANGDHVIPLTFKKLSVTSSKEVAQAYADNEVKADMDYKGKRFMLTETVAGIHSGLFDSMYVTLSKSFSAPQARFKSNEREYVAGLKKGAKIKIICVGAGTTMGSAMFTDCVPFERVVKAGTEKIYREFASQVQQKQLAEWAVALMALLDSETAKVKPKAFKQYLSDYRANKIAEGYLISEDGEAINISTDFN